MLQWKLVHMKKVMPLKKNKFYNFCDEDYNYIIYPEETTKDNKVTKIFMCKTEKIIQT